MLKIFISGSMDGKLTIGYQCAKAKLAHQRLDLLIEKENNIKLIVIKPIDSILIVYYKLLLINCLIVVFFHNFFLSLINFAHT